VDNESHSNDDSNDENDDEENGFVDDSDLDDDLGEFDAHNQMYMLEMMLSFMHGTNVDLHTYWRQKKGIKL